MASSAVAMSVPAATVGASSDTAAAGSQGGAIVRLHVDSGQPYLIKAPGSVTASTPTTSATPSSAAVTGTEPTPAVAATEDDDAASPSQASGHQTPVHTPHPPKHPLPHCDGSPP